MSFSLRVQRGSIYHDYDVEASDSIEALRMKILDKTGQPPSSYNLFFQARRLQDGRTLADYSIGSGSLIRLVPISSEGPWFLGGLVGLGVIFLGLLRPSL